MIELVPYLTSLRTWESQITDTLKNKSSRSSVVLRLWWFVARRSLFQTGSVTYYRPPHQLYFSFSDKHHAQGFIFSLSTSVPPTIVNLQEIWYSVVSDAFEQCGRQNVLTIKPETNIISEYSAAIHMPKQVKCVCSQSKLSSGLVQFVLEKKIL